MVDAVAVAGQDAALTEALDVAGRGGHPRLSAAQATEAVEAAVAASVLDERQVVSEGRPVAGLAFRHPLVRLTCYESLSAVRRRLPHSAYAEAVLRRSPAVVDTLATHLTRADDPRATACLRQAAERAAALYANDTADRSYAELTGRLDALAADATRARIDRSAVLRRLGRYEEAAGLLGEALEELGRRGGRGGPRPGRPARGTHAQDPWDGGRTSAARRVPARSGHPGGGGERPPPGPRGAVISSRTVTRRGSPPRGPRRRRRSR
ncbi:hypothetical protein [Streptomyces sp. c-19]|uniref:hypothetical protein n=1 Tax=Streptomyces sp. c-19 TaxID=2789275 RepID=UPI003980AB58